MKEDVGFDDGEEVEEDVDEDFLHDRAREVVENALSEDFEGSVDEEFDGPDFGEKMNELDEKVEKNIDDKSQAPWSREEVEFLKNNRKSMSNDEMEDFLKKSSDFHDEVERNWTPFSRSEKRFILQHFQAKKPEEIAENLDRDVKAVEMQMKIMGIQDYE